MLLLYQKKAVFAADLKPNLHSTMLLLYLLRSALHRSALHIYIPLCFYFIAISSAIAGINIHIYIPLCFYFIRMCHVLAKTERGIYIPLCFYFIGAPSLRGSRRHLQFTFHYASTLSRPRFPLLFSSIQVYFLSTPLSSYLSSQKSSSSHFTKFKFSLIFQALSISQQFSSISGRQS